MPILRILKLHFITIPNLQPTGCALLNNCLFIACKTEEKVRYTLPCGWHQYLILFRWTEGWRGLRLHCTFFLHALNNYSPFSTLLPIFSYLSLVIDMVGYPGNEDLHVFVIRNTKLVLHKTSWEMALILHIWSLLGWAWVSTTLVGLHCKHVCVCLFACLWPYIP